MDQERCCLVDVGRFHQAGARDGGGEVLLPAMPRSSTPLVGRTTMGKDGAVETPTMILRVGSVDMKTF